ncbi:CoA transferase [uncultured Sulfitobacter sp.]|uniref:CoA transferase n=1 Tax=uncultured Sulfitobacter sp. TaxID=191468 RepID=UPI0026257C88|nr:CoA transferase [uncultured Sulfitobacter sp.]
MSTPTTAHEILIVSIARLLRGTRHVAVGAASPIPAAGAMLARALAETQDEPKLRLSILGSVAHNFFTNGSAELFDCAAQGRIDAFFLGGGQIDGSGNVNLVGVGDYPEGTVRWPGSFGSAFLYFQIPRVILFREEHTPRVMVEKVDFISAPGVSSEGIWRKGGPHALLTGKGLFGFDATRPGFHLQTLHPGHTLEDVTAATGFRFSHAHATPETPPPDAATLALIRGRIRDELHESYPDFAATLRTAPLPSPLKEPSS